MRNLFLDDNLEPRTTTTDWHRALVNPRILLTTTAGYLSFANITVDQYLIQTVILGSRTNLANLGQILW